MDFTLKPKITKELILSKYSEEQIMEYYLHVQVKKGLFRSPLRKDNYPTCSFFRNKSGTLIFKDFATGQYLDIFGVVQTLFQCSYYTSLEIIANDLNIIKNNNLYKNKGKINSNPKKIENKEICHIQVEIQPFTELELKWWEKYGITEDILKKFDVYSCKHVFINGNLCASSQQHCPIFGYYGKKYQGVELWKIYFPKRKHSDYRFLGNYPSEKLQGYKQLPKKGKFCVITKALKDVMALYAYNIPACAPNSETVIPKESIINELSSRFEKIFILWDNDLTGITFLNKIKRKYPQFYYLIIPRHLEAKDFSDLRKKYGYKHTAEFIKQYLTWLKNRT